jgi:hypothetical protein
VFMKFLGIVTATNPSILNGITHNIKLNLFVVLYIMLKN